MIDVMNSCQTGGGLLHVDAAVVVAAVAACTFHPSSVVMSVRQGKLEASPSHERPSADVEVEAGVLEG